MWLEEFLVTRFDFFFKWGEHVLELRSEKQLILARGCTGICLGMECVRLLGRFSVVLCKERRLLSKIVFHLCQQKICRSTDSLL